MSAQTGSRIRIAADLWDRVAAQCSYATFFHTRPWVELMVSTFPRWEDATVARSLPGRRTAILPLVQRKRMYGMLREYQSVIPGVYGGVICDGPIDQHEVDGIYGRLKTMRASGGVIVGNPFAEFALPGHLAPKGRTTQVVDLSGGIDAVWARMESAFRRRVRRSRDHRVLVEEAVARQDFDEYYAVYLDALRRWGERATSRYPEALFTNLWHLATRSRDAVKLWVARAQGHVAAGAVVLYHQRHAVSWHAATREDDYATSPANALQMAIIEDACRRGFRWYDLNPSGGHSGVARFKKGLGARDLSFDCGVLETGALGRLSQPLSGFAGRLAWLR